MSIADKLTTIAANQHRIYQAGYDKGLEEGGLVGDDYVVDTNPPNTIKTYTDNLSLTIADNQFKDFKKLTTVTAPYVKEIGSHAFDGCSKLANVQFGSHYIEKLGDYAFNSCVSLINIPKVSLGWNEDCAVGAFANCVNLEIVEYCLQDLRDKSFSGCTKLKALVDRNAGSAESYIPTALEGTPIANGTGYLYVLSKLLADYEADENWVASGIKFRAFEDYTVDGTEDGELDLTKI